MTTTPTRGGPRRRINAPRSKDEAARLVASLEAKWGIVRMEEHLADMVASQAERHNKREIQVVMKTVQLVMLAAGIKTLSISEDDLHALTSQPDPDVLAVEQRDGGVTFTIKNDRGNHV